MAKWQECAVPSMRMEDFMDCECWVGVDLASKIDLAAMMFLFRVPASHKFAEFVKSEYALFGKYYLPEETVERPENAPYRRWRDQGVLTVTPGARTDFTYLENDLKILAGRFDLLSAELLKEQAASVSPEAAAAAETWLAICEGDSEAEKDRRKQALLTEFASLPKYNFQELAYDPREAEYLMQNIREWASFECVEVGQSPSNISEPMKEFEALYLSGKLKHNGCPMLKWQASNVIRKNSSNKSYYPAKQKPANKIDGIVAAIMALARAMLHESSAPADLSGFLERSVCI